MGSGVPGQTLGTSWNHVERWTKTMKNGSSQGGGQFLSLAFQVAIGSLATIKHATVVFPSATHSHIVIFSYSVRFEHIDRTGHIRTQD